MAVRIRLSRGGAIHAPFYYIVAANSTSPRDGKFIEKLGYYNPRVSSEGPKPNKQQETEHNKRLSFNSPKIQEWIKKGAQISQPLAKILNKGGFEEAAKFLKPVVEGEFFKVPREEKKKIRTERKNTIDAQKASMQKKKEDKAKALKESKLAASTTNQ